MSDVQRVVSTLLKLDGEQQYKAAIANIRSEQSALKANVKLLDEQFKGQSNTMAALTAKQQALNAVYDNAQRKVTLVSSAYEKAQAAVKRYTAEVDAIKAKIAAEGDAEGKLAKQLETAQTNLQAAQNATVKYGGDVAKAKTEVEKINNQIKDNSKYLDEAKKSAAGTATSIDQYGKKVAQAKEESKDFGNTGKEAFDDLAQALIAAGLIRGVTELIDLMKRASFEFINFESAAAGVSKTFKGTPEQLAAVMQSIKEMSTQIPIATSNIAKLVEIGGQLSVPVADQTGFARVMSAIGVSTDIPAETAAITIAQLTGITETSSEMFSNFGSALVALGNNSKTFESKILDMAMGIAAAGKQIRLSDADILGFATTLASKGLEAQAGGTAMSRMMLDLSAAAAEGAEGLSQYAEVAGMSAEQFYQLFKGSAIDAINAFFNGLATGGENATAVLNELNITEMRQRDAMLRLSTSQDILRKYVDLSNTAYSENTALMAEAEKRYATTESKIQLLKNAVSLLGVTIGGQYNPSVKSAVVTLTEWTESIDQFIKDNPGVVQAVTGFAAAVGVLALSLAGFTFWTKLAAPAIVAFNTALTSNPIGAVAVSLAALTAMVVAAGAAAGETASEYDELVQQSEAMIDSLDAASSAHEEKVASIIAESEAVDGLIGQLESLTREQSNNNQNTAQIKNVVDQLNAAVADLNVTYDETTGSLSMTTAAMRDMTDAMFDQKYQAAMVDRQVEAFIALQDAERKHSKTVAALKIVQDEANTSMSNTMMYINGVRVSMDQSSIGNGRYTETINELTERSAEEEAGIKSLAEELLYLSETVTGASDVTGSAIKAFDSSTVAGERLVKTLELLQDTWIAARDSALDAAEKASEGFKKLDGAAKDNADTYDDILIGQKDFWGEYASNLQWARENGLDDGLLMELADETEDSAQRLAAIVKLSPEEITAINEAAQARTQAMEEYSNAKADAIAAASELYETMIDDLKQFAADMDQKDGAYMNGVDTMDGLLTGLESKLPDLYAFINGVLAEIGRLSNGAMGTKPSLSWLLSHKTGLDYVPFDDYIFKAHEGEAVLTKEEASLWRLTKAMRSTMPSATPSITTVISAPKQVSVSDVESAARAGAQSGAAGNTYNSYLTINAPEMPDAYEIARQQRIQQRRTK